jgi:hypothetical protein
MAGFRLYLQNTHLWKKSTAESLAKAFYPKVKKCLENQTKIILVPISLRTTGGGGHQNLLILKPEIKTAYRMEHHGEGYHGSGGDKDEEAVNILLKSMFENKDLIKALGKFKYVPPSETCPVISKSVRAGFQSMEGVYKNSLSESEQKKLKEIESGGFCQAWTFFMMELYMLNPETTIEEIYIIAHDELENDPQSFRELIRGYILDVNRELKQFTEFSMGKKERDTEKKIIEYYDQEIEKLIKEQKFKAKEKHEELLKKLSEQFFGKDSDTDQKIEKIDDITNEMKENKEKNKLLQNQVEKLIDQIPNKQQEVLIEKLVEVDCSHLVVQELHGTEKERKKQYLKQALLLHPDKNPEECKAEAEKAFKKLNDMYKGVEEEDKDKPDEEYNDKQSSEKYAQELYQKVMKEEGVRRQYLVEKYLNEIYTTADYPEYEGKKIKEKLEPLLRGSKDLADEEADKMYKEFSKMNKDIRKNKINIYFKNISRSKLYSDLQRKIIKNKLKDLIN